MGFSSAMQGLASHEALLTRQDAEIRLLENMRRCIGLRVKADRDYAIALNSFVLQAARKMESVELAGSLVATAWTVFIEETEKVVKYIKESADFMSGTTLEKVSALCAEKKANRKQYQDEYGRISMELHRLQDAVAKTRQDYERCLDNFMQAKNKLEQHQQSAVAVAPRRMDEAKERYQKACKKLHLTHNEYVLLLCEASEFERDMRTILVPGLLEHQQAIQEDMIDKWKIVLQEVQKCCNTADKKFQDLHSKIDSGVTAIRSSNEYSTFIDQNKTSPPSAIHFKFDKTLVKQTQLASDAIVLDDLTVDSLRQRLQENEARLNECRSHIKDKQTLIIQYETELATVRFKSDANSVARMFSVKKVADVLKKEVNELRCAEQKLVRQNELIGTPLEELGCEQPPSALAADPIFSGTGLSSLDQAELDGAGGQGPSSLGKISRSRITGPVTSLLKKPVKAVGNKMFGSAQSLTSTSRNDLTQEFEVTEAPDPSNVAAASSTATTTTVSSTSTGASTTTTPTATTVESPQRPPKQRQHVVDAADNDADAIKVLDVPPPPRPPSQLQQQMQQREQQQQQQQPQSPTSTMKFEHGRPLEEELWFHGVLPRGEVVRLLEMDGDFLVRETTRNDEKQIVLSVMWTSPKHFIVQTSPEGLFRFEGPAFATVQQLIIHQFQSGASVTSRSGAVLKTPILREKWELNNDDVELLEKIGRGNFGDVYRANLKDARTGVPVAVKTCKVTLPEEHKKKFLQEGRILKQYDHPNIVKFIGICVQKQPIMIVMELVPGGSLLNFLRNHGANLTQKNLLGMCLDAAAGMEYLESKNCIHRDLAARNCLVGEGNVVKISDFGMSREEEEYTVSDGLKQIPIKWTAPEALNYGKYTSLCDVWSYGVLSWEIFSRGGTPYQGMTNTRAREMLDSGYRMPAPEGTPEEMYQLMLRCWNYEPEDRPHFAEIHGAVELLYSRLFRRRSIVTFEKPPPRSNSEVSSPNGHRRAESQMSTYSTDSRNWFVSTLRRTFAKKKSE